MARTPTFPPRITTVRGQDRCFAKGRYHYLGATGSDESKAKYAALVAELSETKTVAPPISLAALTVADVVLLFMKHAETHYSTRGRELCMFRLSVRPLLSLFGTLAVADFGPRRLKQLQVSMADGSWTDDQSGWCRNVCNRRLVRIKTLWQWAESEELVPAGTTAALRTVKGLPKNARGVRHTTRRQATPWDDLQRVLPFCPSPVRIMLELQWWTGCRSQDVRLMRADRIDTDSPVWLYTPEIDKGDWREGAEESPRTIPLGPECQRLLIGWAELRGDLSGYLFPPSRRRKQPCYTPFSYTQAVSRACVRAGVKIVPYGGRHAARMRIGRELGDEAARAFLGQKSINTTQLYGSIDQAHAAEAAAKMA